MFGGSTVSSFGFGQQQKQPQTGGIFGTTPAQSSFGSFGSAQPFGLFLVTFLFN